MAQMTRDEAYAFLAAGTRTGKVAVTRGNGRPHVTPIWFVVDGDDLVFTTDAGSVKGRTLRRDPRVALAVDDQTPPYSFVMVEGTAEITADHDELLRFATLIGGRYMGAEHAEEFGRRNAVEGEVLVRIHPTRVSGVSAVSD